MKNMNYEIVIGLEVHVQVKTQSKIFCPCPVDSSAAANTNICPVCCGYPGTLPVFNHKALEMAVRAGLALNCRINPRIYFERKNYFYPDLPKGYQISQYKLPLAENGFLELASGKKIGITRVHLEEDAGKLVHKENYSLVDLNRAGTPLMEIVSEPDIRSPQEAFEYLTYLKMSMQYAGVSDCDMEKGSLRCDANISLRKTGDTKLGIRVELKNMNSFRGVREALEYEADRQAKLLDSGETVVQETRLWDVDNGRSQVMRTKEESHDYRYFPEPDLPDFLVAQAVIDEQKKFVGESPLARHKRFVEEYKLSESEITILVNDKRLADFFENACRAYPEPKKIVNWLLGPFLEQVNVLPGGLDEVKISVENFAKVVRLFSEGKMNNLAAKKALALSMAADRDVDEIVKTEGLVQVSGEADLTMFVDATIRENAKAVEQYRAGKLEAVMFLVGQVMKKTQGKANPRVVKEMLEKSLK